VQVGTRFLVAKECGIHANYKQFVLKANDIDTMATGRRLGHPVRAIKNAFTREFLAKEYDSAVSDEKLENFGVGALRLAAVEGDVIHGSFLAGQIAGMVKNEQTAKEIIDEMSGEAEKILSEASAKWVK